MAHYESDEYRYYRHEDEYDRQPRRRARASSGYLVPEPGSRPQGGGQGRSPEIHIHNDMYQEAYQRAASPAPPPPRGRRPEVEQPIFYPVGVPQPMQAPAPPVQFPQVVLQSRSRSRSRSHSSYDRRRDEDRRREEEHWKDMMKIEEYKRREQEVKAKDEQERAISEYRRRREREDEEQKRAVADFERRKELEKEEQKRAVADFERRKELERDEQKRAIEKYNAEQAAKKKAEKEEEEAAIRKWEQEQDDKRKKKKEAEEEAVRKWEQEQESKKKKQKEEQEEAIRKWKQEEEAKKKKAEEEEKEWIAKLKAKEEAEKEKKKKAQEEEDEAVRKRLAKLGFQHNQIEAMINADEKKEKSKSTALTLVNSHPPVFPKIHRDHIAIETLNFYELPWEYDRKNRDYIIILQEMDERETNVLFEHTKRIRTTTRTTLAIEARKGDKPEYAWVRRRSKSRGKSPARREKLAELILR